MARLEKSSCSLSLDRKNIGRDTSDPLTCITAKEFRSLFNGSIDRDKSLLSEENGQFDGCGSNGSEADNILADPELVYDSNTYVFVSRETGEAVVLKSTGHISTVKTLIMLRKTPSLWVELRQISLMDAVQDTANHRLTLKDGNRSKNRSVLHSTSILSPTFLGGSDSSPWNSLRRSPSPRDQSEGVLPSGSVRLPTPANNWGGFGIAQWTANELLASLEVRRAELDEDLTKVQTIVNRNIKYCMLSAYKNGLSSRMDKRSQVILYSYATIWGARALSIGLPDLMDIAQESLRGISALQAMAAGQFKTNARSATDSEDRWILLALGKAKRYTTDILKEAIRQKEAKMVISHSNVVSTGDFNVIRVINKGGHSTVYLGRKNGSRELYAIKAISKATLSDLHMRQRVLHERQIMSLLDDKNPYVCRLCVAFRSSDYLFLVQEYVDGGDCNTLLRTCGPLSVQAALHLIAEISLGVGFLHQQQVVHRDLKPDNILISGEGHAKIADFGLSRKKQRNTSIMIGDSFSENLSWYNEDNEDRAIRPPLNLDLSFRPLQEKGMLYSPVGTQLYLAPEVVLGMGYDFQVDWWSVGIMMYEFLMGKTPFEGEDVDNLYNNIISGLPNWPEDSPISPDVQHLISKLLATDPNRRLGASGIEEIKKHRAFFDTPWGSLYNLHSPLAPYLDRLNLHMDNEMDEGAEGIPLDEVLSKVDEGSSSPSDLEKMSSQNSMTGESCWGKFSYINMNAFSGGVDDHPPAHD